MSAPQHPNPHSRHHNEAREASGNIVQAGSVGGSITFAPPPPPDPPHQAPNADPKYTNRVEELTCVENLATRVLHDRKGARALLTGREGIGKSVTLAEAAHRVLDRFDQGNLHHDLGKWRDPEGVLDLAGVLRSMLRSLSVGGLDQETDTSVLHDRLRAVTGRKRLLLLLDGVADETELDALSLGAGPHLVLAACEPELDTPGDAVTRGAEHLRLDAFTPKDSLALLKSFRGVERGLAEPREDAAAERLVELCGHLPGVVRMAAAQLETQELRVSDLVEAIEERRRSSVRPVSGAEIVVDIAVSGLGPNEYRLLEFLATHPGRSFSEGLAWTLLGEEEGPKALGGLTDAGLLHANTQGDRRIVELVRGRVREDRNEQWGLDAAAIVRFYTCTHHLADKAMLGERYRLTGELTTAELTIPQRDHQTPFTGRSQAAEWQDTQLVHVPDLMTLALELGDRVAALVLADAVWPTCYGRRRLRMGIRIYQRALEVARDTHHHGAIARCANYLARLYLELGMADRVFPLVEEADRSARLSGHRRNLAVVLETQGLLKARLPDLEGFSESAPAGLPEGDALKLLTDSRDIHRFAGFPRGDAMQTYQLGDQARRGGDLRTAFTELREAERIADLRLDELSRTRAGREVRWMIEDWKLLRARVRLSLARTLVESGQPEEAAHKAESALGVFSAVAEPVKQVQAARFLAELDHGEGASGRALDRLRWAGAVARHHHLQKEAEGITRDFARYSKPGPQG